MSEPHAATERTRLLADPTSPRLASTRPSRSPSPSKPGPAPVQAVAAPGQDPARVEHDPRAGGQSPLRKFLRFCAIWTTVAVIVGFCIVQSIRKGHGEFDWKGALKKAGGGGLAGALSMVLQVLLLLPLRTIMNYQYRHGGTSFTASYRHLVAPESTGGAGGGFARLYAGLAPALVQGPVARFGDTASNAGVLALLGSNPWARALPSAVQTACASALGALFRMVLMPIDTLKTTMQTESNARALVVLRARIATYGPATLWAGAFATAAANFVGSFPWFATYNYLSLHLAAPSSDPAAHSHAAFVLLSLSRQALIGFASSVVSDSISNSVRVVKTYRQTSDSDVGYRQATREIWARDGPTGLFGRGLKTRLLANGVQGVLFSVLWKLFQDLLERRNR
ncbi:hypothetical protein JCM11491_006015 [Sporobolomyces phaffii]